MAEHVVIKSPVSFTSNAVKPLQEVRCGHHIEEFIDYQKSESGLDARGAMNLRNSACDILSYCNPHDAVSNMPVTHLVVGYVQSGKTMSFTSVIKLAMDNNYRVVVVLAGVTNNLLGQTDDRLGTDLACNNVKNYRVIKIHKNPDETKIPEICRNLKIKDSLVVINILKHPDRIDKVTKLLQDQLIKDALSNETVLIIDDEADQASLNSFGRANSREGDGNQQMSSTYESILSLRNELPGNSYIQYTATPQANILISTLDALSPKTHTLLYPGTGYCGGKLFFGKGEEGKRFGDGLVIRIPDEEVFNSRVNPLASIPASLEYALMLHLWAVVIHTRFYETVEQLSMMVHTDVTLDWNSTFHSWIETTLSNWSSILESKDFGVAKYKLIDRFKTALAEATKLFDDADLTFDNLSPYLTDVLNDTHTYLITGETDDMENLDWKEHSSNILVGAQMLNRGFTVEKLTTTYMPRYTLGVTNADTIEQRCRFFGYKEKYIRSCRVFLPQVSIDNYKHYIDSEEELRQILAQTSSLEECGHKILTYPKLRPTRANILPKTVVTNLKGMRSLSPYETLGQMEYNKALCEELLSQNTLVPFVKSQYNAGDYNPETTHRVHTSFRVDVDTAVGFLKMYQYRNSGDMRTKADTVRYLLYLKELGLIKDIAFVNMSSGKYKGRTLDKTTHKITSNLFNGPSNSGDKEFYLGDDKMYVDDTVTIQLHHILLENVPGMRTIVLSVYFPKQLSVKYISSL